MAVFISGTYVCPSHPVPGACPLCIANVSGRSNYKGHFRYRPRRQKGRFSVPFNLSKFRNRTQSTKDNAGAHDPEFVLKYPALHECLTVDRIPGPKKGDFKRVQTFTLSVFVEDGVFKGSLNDREGGLYAFATAQGIEELFVTFEAGLQGDHLDWRVSKWKGKKKV